MVVNSDDRQLKRVLANKVEPVLVVPAKLTSSAYAVLVSHNAVARKWHNEGRYGSRTHPVDGIEDASGRKCIGLPLLETPETIDWIVSFLGKRDNGDAEQPNPETTSYANNSDINVDENVDENEDEHKHKNERVDSKKSLRDLLSTPGVQLIYETPTVSNRIPKIELFDATVHKNRMPQSFPSKMRQFLDSLVL